MTERRYRVLFVASHPVQYQSPVFRRLAAHPGVDIHVAYCSLRGAEEGYDPEFGAKVKWDVPLLEGYPWTLFAERGWGKESFFSVCNPGLWKFIRNGKFDAVVSYVGYVYASFWIALAAAKLSGSAFVFGTDAGSLASRDGRKWKMAVKRLAWPQLFSLADQIIVPSSAAVELMRSLSIPEARITLTPFVVDNDWWIAQARNTDRAATRAAWGVSPGDLVVLFCAKLQDWKRPLDLLRAFAKAGVPDSVLVFAGEGPLRSQIGSEAAALGSASRVRILGFKNQTQLPAVYCAADLFVLPSNYDPCPVVVCEAMLCGLPVILSDQIRGRFDLVRPGVTGDIYTCGDTDALAASLKRLLADRAALAVLAANARAGMETWSPSENVAATVEAISRSVGRRQLESSTSSAGPSAKSAPAARSVTKP